MRKIKVDGVTYQIRPSFILPYFRAKTEEASKGLFLLRFGVPFWALAFVFGHNPMWWYRLYLSFSENSIVGTTIKNPEDIPTDLIGDEQHIKVRGQKAYVATTVAENCFLGVSVCEKADEKDLAKGYGVFKQEATYALNTRQSNQTIKFPSKDQMLKLENILGFTKKLLKHPFVLALLEILSSKDSEIEELTEKVKELETALSKKQGVPPKPDVSASELDNNSKDKQGVKEKKPRKTGKKSKKKALTIHEEKFVKAEGVPAGWKLVKHSPVIIEDVIVQCHNVCYQLEVWRSPDGKQQMSAQLPEYLQGSHFGPMLRSFVLALYHDLDSTQPCISSFLKNIGVEISVGSVNNLLIENQDLFHNEKEQILQVGKSSQELRTDDTGAKHNNQNYFTNCINTDYFAYFHTSKTKSRINFLEILRQHNTAYTLNQSSLDYYESVGCPKSGFELFKQEFSENGVKVFANQKELTDYLAAHQISGTVTKRILTEGLLIGTMVSDGFDEQTIIHSDEAGQFDLFVHSLCWKHVERPLRKLKIYNSLQEQQLQQVKHQFWELYQRLKKYKLEPDPNLVDSLQEQFEQLCKHQEGFFALNEVLDKIHKKKSKMLVVLKRPETSLHNNDSERDIRTFVKRRKISGSTKSEAGLKAKDTFMSLKKTCKKLNISFWEYLKDRIYKSKKIPNLATIIEQKMNAQKHYWANT